MKRPIYSLIILLFASLFIILSSCNKEDNPLESSNDISSVTNKVKNLQDKNDSLLTVFIASKDTVSALNSLLQVYLKDTSVASGYVSSQGISIIYKSGIKGGILLNPEDGSPLLNKENKNMGKLFPPSINGYSPTSKKTIFINPHYSDRVVYANAIINLCNNIFPKNGYNPPATFLDNAATVDVMTNLAGYGIVHIYSHGWAWPTKKSITEIYLMTGETVNPVTTKKYEAEILQGNIPLIKVHKNDNRYFISPSFFANKNNFAKDSTIVYGGFCYSFLGGWPNAIIDVAKAGAYTGFTWRVLTNKNASWAQSLFDTLSNNTVKAPKSLDYWFTKTPAVAKQYFDAADNVTCKIQYAGHSDLTFWQNAIIDSVSPNKGIAGTSVMIYGKGFGSAQGTSKVSFNGINASASTWSETKIKVTVPSGNFAGYVVVTVKNNESNKVLFNNSANSSMNFSFTWVEKKQSYWPRFNINFTVSGTVEGQNGNNVTKINNVPYVDGLVKVYFSNYGAFKINFTSTFSVSPMKVDTTYSDGSSDVFTVDGNPIINWWTSNFTPYTFNATNGGTFENPYSFGSISIMGYMNSKLERYDKNKKLVETISSQSGWGLGIIDFDKQ